MKLVKKHGLAWILLTASLAIHVMDEAVNDFLSVYNPVVVSIRNSYPFLPLPTFTFPYWITNLILAIVLLFAVSIFVYRGKRGMVFVSYLYGGLMIVNGLTHFAGAIYFGEVMPGTWSAPLLIIASVYLILMANKVSKMNRNTETD
jgi:hypothetical protein